MLITDKRTLDFLEILKSTGKIRFEIEFCEAIGLQKQNLVKIKNQDETRKENHFTAAQLAKVAEIYGADMNYIFGISDYPFRKIKKIPVNI